MKQNADLNSPNNGTDNSPSLYDMRMKVFLLWLAKRQPFSRLIPLYLDLKFLRLMPASQIPKLLAWLPKSKPQLRQDLFVLSELSFMQNGYFVEIGATNGYELSNTYLLETGKRWSGILVEPAKCWHSQIRINRRNSIIETNCVWKNSGSSLPFVETSDRELSTVEEFNIFTELDSRKKVAAKYDVTTVSLLDLLNKHGAPNRINYLSIDTEGSEFEILNAFDFTAYSFDVITCEHNYTANREKIYQLLTWNGYRRVNQKVSQFDDWYVKS